MNLDMNPEQKIKKDDWGYWLYMAPRRTKSIQSHGFKCFFGSKVDYLYRLAKVWTLTKKSHKKIGETLSPEETAYRRIQGSPNLDAGEEVWGETPLNYNGETEGMAYARKDNGAGMVYD